MTESAMTMAAFSDALRHVVADLFPEWPYEEGDILHVGKRPAETGEVRVHAWMRRGDHESEPLELGEDATQAILAAMLNHVEGQ